MYLTFEISMILESTLLMCAFPFSSIVWNRVVKYRKPKPTKNWQESVLIDWICFQEFLFCSTAWWQHRSTYNANDLSNFQQSQWVIVLQLFVFHPCRSKLEALSTTNQKQTFSRFSSFIFTLFLLISVVTIHNAHDLSHN